MLQPPTPTPGQGAGRLGQAGFPAAFRADRLEAADRARISISAASILPTCSKAPRAGRPAAPGPAASKTFFPVFSEAVAVLLERVRSLAPIWSTRSTYRSGLPSGAA